MLCFRLGTKKKKKNISKKVFYLSGQAPTAPPLLVAGPLKKELFVAASLTI